MIYFTFTSCWCQMLPVPGEQDTMPKYSQGITFGSLWVGVGGWHGSALIGHWLRRQRARSFLVWRIALNIQAWQSLTSFTSVKRRFNEAGHRGGKIVLVVDFLEELKREKEKEAKCRVFPLLTPLFCLGQRVTFLNCFSNCKSSKNY